MLLILLVTYSLLPLLSSHITKLSNFESLQAQVLNFTFLSILILLLVISSSLLTLIVISILMIPEVQSPAWHSSLKPRLLYLFAYLISPLGYLVGILNVTYPKLKSLSFSPNLSTSSEDITTPSFYLFRSNS